MIKDEKNLFTSSLEHTQISVNDLNIGMYVTELDRPWLDTPFMFQGFELKSKGDIQSVQQLCEFVYINVSKQKK